MDIYELEHATGVVVSVGGQLPQNIALRLQEAGGGMSTPILSEIYKGTVPQIVIHMSHVFSRTLNC